MSKDRVPFLRALAEALVRQPGASMEQLAQSIGVSRATLHRHMSSREDLVRAIGRYAGETCLQTFKSLRLEDGPPEQVLIRLVEALTPDAGLYLFLRRNLTTLVHLEELNQEWEEQRRILVSFFQRGQEAGVFRVDLPAPWLVDALGALLNSAAESVHEGRLARAQMNEVVCTLMLEGVKRHQAEPGSL